MHVRAYFTPSLGIALLALVAFGTPGSASAQPPADDAPLFDVEARLTELTTRLGLDTAQAAQARVILVDAQQDLARARASVAPGGAPLPVRRREILFRVEDRLWAILTCPQKDAFRLYVRERMVERMEHRGDHGGPRGRHHGHRGHGGRGPR